MNKGQFYRRYQSLGVPEYEIERKWQVYLTEKIYESIQSIQKFGNSTSVSAVGGGNPEDPIITVEILIDVNSNSNYTIELSSFVVVSNPSKGTISDSSYTPSEVEGEDQFLLKSADVFYLYKVTINTITQSKTFEINNDSTYQIEEEEYTVYQSPTEGSFNNRIYNPSSGYVGNIVFKIVSEGILITYTGTIIEAPQVLYTNLPTYIVDGTRQANTYATIRSNVTFVRKLVVEETVTIGSMTFIRTPQWNWTNVGASIRPTLSIINGTGATIDGETASKQFFNLIEAVYNPPTAEGRDPNSLEQYELYKMGSTSDTVLTPGEYRITLSTLSGGNVSIATLVNSSFPIDTSGSVYPNTTETLHFVIEIMPPEN